jgi:EAL domain-containing protein (putative c-di-GMP-specific phosphodiesterase class I)
MRSHYCTEMQGYLFGWPMPAAALEEVLRGTVPEAQRA